MTDDTHAIRLVESSIWLASVNWSKWNISSAYLYKTVEASLTKAGISILEISLPIKSLINFQIIDGVKLISFNAGK